MEHACGTLWAQCVSIALLLFDSSLQTLKQEAAQNYRQALSVFADSHACMWARYLCVYINDLD